MIPLYTGSLNPHLQCYPEHGQCWFQMSALSGFPDSSDPNGPGRCHRDHSFLLPSYGQMHRKVHKTFHPRIPKSSGRPYYVLYIRTHCINMLLHQSASARFYPLFSGSPAAGPDNHMKTTFPMQQRKTTQWPITGLLYFSLFLSFY